MKKQLPEVCDPGCGPARPARSSRQLVCVCVCARARLGRGWRGNSRSSPGGGRSLPFLASPLPTSRPTRPLASPDAGLGAQSPLAAAELEKAEAEREEPAGRMLGGGAQGAPAGGGRGHRAGRVLSRPPGGSGRGFRGEGELCPLEIV